MGIVRKVCLGSQRAKSFFRFLLLMTACLISSVISLWESLLKKDADNASTNWTVIMDADVAFEVEHLTELEPSTQDEVCDIIVKSPSVWWSWFTTHIPAEASASARTHTPIDYFQYKWITGWVNSSMLFKKGQC